MLILRRSRLFTAAFLIAGLSTRAWADHPNNARGFDIGKPYQMNGIDNVNLFNGSLTVTIPIGQRYHVNGGLGYGLTLIYNSNLWDTVENDTTFNPSQTRTYPNRRSNAGMGWLLSLGRLFPPNQFPVQESGSWNYETADGALHDFGVSSQTGAGPFIATDGSYLRLVVDGSDRRVEFPDGTWQVFKELNRAASPWVPATTATGIWRLTEIHDRFNNLVKIGYSNTAENPEIWTIDDGTRTQTVYFANAKSASWADQYDLVLDRVVLAAFGSSQATWQLAYSNQVVIINNPGPHPVGSFSYNVHLPVSLTLPLVNNVSQVYSMRQPNGTPFYNISTFAGLGNGALLGLQLPTGGWTEWDYNGFLFTTAPDEAVSRSLAVGQRRMLSADRSVTNTWTYNREESVKRQCQHDGVPYYYPSEQLVVSVTSPELVTTVHYFSIYQTPMDTLCALSGAPPFDGGYGLPITAAITGTFDGQQRYLSEETYLGTPSITTGPGQYRVTGGTLQRSGWALYRPDMALCGTSSSAGSFPCTIESAHATKYDDDMHCGTGQTPSDACYTSVTRYLPDGAGHYRQSSTGGNFPSGNYVTSLTNYTGFDQNAWILNRFTEECRVEDDTSRPALSATSCSSLASAVSGGSILSGPHVEQFCFDSNGFLARRRELASASPAANDLVSVFTQTAGNVTQEDYYGGDAQNSMPVTNFCTASLGSPAYSVAHTYSYGSLATSQYLATNGHPAPGFLSTDNTIDASTGLVRFSRDAALIETAYLYDALERITSVTPPTTSEVPTTFSYSESTVPFKVTAQRVSNSGTIQAITEFDSFGRVAREQQTLPATTTSRTTTYTGSGLVNTVSQWESTPSHNTSYTYDAFGRPLTVTAPDGSVSTVDYFGARATTRTVRMGTARSGTVISQTPTSTTETYDRQGRLSNVHDAAGNDTSYGYDVSGHLTEVLMGVQTRLFTYDGRGFLTSEQHPELNGAAGTVLYGGFDARGHAGTKLLGTSLSDFDVAYTYDAAERLIRIDQITSRSTLSSRLLKAFTFDGVGRLSQDLRHSYRGSDDFKVTEDYTYRSTDGKLTGRDTTIDKNTTRLQKFTQSYDYTDVGALSTLTYPTCPDTSRPCGASSLSAVTPVFAKGMITSLPGFATNITYHDDGTVNQIAHPGTITDTYEADDYAMGRPKSIAFAFYDNCAPPSSVSISRTPAGTLTPQTTVQLTATPAPGSSTPITYQWYRVVNSNAVPITDATSSTFSEAIGTTTTYRVRIANGCGGRDSADVDVPVCSPVAITVQPAAQSSSPVTLTVTATGCGTLSYQWYQISGASNVAVGTNAASYNTGTLSTTTTFWVKVTDSPNGTSVNSNNAVVTAGSCTPQITDDLHDQAVDYGGGVSVHVTVSGCAGKTYHWYSGQAGDMSTPLFGGYFDGNANITNQQLNHGPIWVRVDGNNITPVNSRTAMISVRPVAANAAVTPNTTNQITVSWQAFAHHYLVKRCANGTCDVPFSWSSGTSFNDVNRNLNTTYVYSIASVDVYGTASAYSNPDIATTMSFTPVVSGGVINRTHINELLTAVNLVRAANGSPPITWSAILPGGVPEPPAAGQATTEVYAAHITSLRTQMDAALAALGIAVSPYTDPQTLTFIKAVHFTDVQARIR
jgi:YD repeat-containing protein